MSIEGLIAGLILTGLTIGWVALPFIRSGGFKTDDLLLDRQYQRALTYYERVLRNIRDLDEDYATAKIHVEDYEEERDVWVSRGVRLLQLLDDLEGRQGLDMDHMAGDAAIDRAIEQAVQAVQG